MVTGATAPTNNASSSSSFTATTIIKKLAPSPRDAPSPSNNNKWRSKQPLSPRNNIITNRDGASPKNNGGISNSRMALKINRHPSPLRPQLQQPQCEKGKETSSTTTTITTSASNPITAVPPIERSRSPDAATASVVPSLYSGAPTIASTTPVSHVVSSPRLADTTAVERIALSTEPKTSPNVETSNPIDAIAADQSPLPVTTNDNDNSNVVEFYVDDLVAPPPLLALPVTSHVMSPKTSTGTRSKIMLVVDPKSGRKYDLKTDDHSLTDKELYVIHKSDESRMVLSPDSSCNKTPTAKNTSTKANSGYFWRSPPITPTNTTTNIDFPILHFSDDNPKEAEGEATLLLHNVDSLLNDATLDTASAITDVSYRGHPQSSEYGRRANGGLLRRCGATLGGLCLIDDDTEVDVLSAILADEYVHMAEKAALSATVAEVKEKEKVVEERDDVDCIPPNYMLENIVGVDDDAEELVHAMLRARTIRKRLSIDGSGSQQDDKQQNPMLSLTAARDLFSPMSITGPPLDLFSPMSSALSTVMSGLANTFSFVNVNDDSGTLHETNMSYTSSVRRVCMIVKSEEVKSCLLDGEAGNSGCVGLLGMKFHQCGHDFQAHVRFLQRGSKAEKMGVKVGDRVSFAVALSNMTLDQQSERLAERLMKRLETVGMRTSYREVYDIFLSKTTNSRPIGMVFRRDRTASKAGPTSPRTANANYITNEFDWSTDFLQSLSIKCREYEFEEKVPFGKVMGHKLVLFLPPPNVDCSISNMEVSDYLNDMLDNLAIGYHCTTNSPMMSCIDSTFVSNNVTTKPHIDYLSNRLLCMLVEQAMGLVFIRREYDDENNTVTGSGFAVVRNAEGSWSAPCFLSLLESCIDDCMDESRPSADVKMIIIRNTAMIVGLNSGNAVRFSIRKTERANLLVRDATIVGTHDGRFLPLAIDFFVLVKANMVLNHGAYASLSTDNIKAKDILTGTLSPPEQSVDFYGALQSLELPYSMHSHPVMPNTLQRYSDSDWVEFLSDHDGTLDASSCGMRTKLALISQRDMSSDIQREIDIFARKFKYYLMDGVPVLRILSATSLGSGMEEKVLRITINDPSSLYSSSLELLRRRRPGVSNVGIPSNFSTTFEAITKLSRTPPTALMTSLDDEELKQFFSIETDLSPGPIMMLAKTKKDAILLLCGLKLLLEREKLASVSAKVKVGVAQRSVGDEKSSLYDGESKDLWSL